MAVRRNVVNDSSGAVKACGARLAECVDDVFTSNIVDRGAYVGLSVSNSDVKEHIYWCITRSQVRKTGAPRYKVKREEQSNSISTTTHFNRESDPPNIYSDNGHGFRINGDAQFDFLQQSVH